MSLRAIRMLLSSLLAASATACLLPQAGGYDAPVRPPLGAIYGNHRAPLQLDFRNTSFGTKRGSSEVQYIRDILITGLPLVSWGSASIRDAARDGGITTVRHVDYEVMNVLGLYVEFTTIVYGD